MNTTQSETRITPLQPLLMSGQIENGSAVTLCRIEGTDAIGVSEWTDGFGSSLESNFLVPMTPELEAQINHHLHAILVLVCQERGRALR